MKNINLGVIGCGSITDSILFLFKITKGFRIIAFCDKDIQKAKKQQKKVRGSQIYDNYLTMIKQEKLDAIYIALPHFLHYSIVKDIIMNNIHVLVEKPVTILVEEANELALLAKKYNVKVAVNYQYRYDSALYQLQCAVKNNDLGDLYFGRCIVPWYRDNQYFEASPWHRKISTAGGGTLITQGSHLLDILLKVFDSDISSIEGTSKNFKFKDVEVEDFSLFTLNFKNGSLLQFISTMAASDEGDIKLDIYGSKATACYTSKLFSSIKFSKKGVRRYSSGVRGLHPIHKSIKGFRNWLLYDTPHFCPIEDSILVLDTIRRIYDSTMKRRDHD